jgi:hypothetical protein
MIEFEYYDWTNLLDDDTRAHYKKSIDWIIDHGNYWHNSPPYQTDVNVFGLPGAEWNNLKMSFIWSCFAFMKKEQQIKSIKSWGYKTNLETQEDRNNYWHQHIRDNNIVLSGVYYLELPEGCNLETSGTEFAYPNPEGNITSCPAKLGHWIIFPGKHWHRPGLLENNNWRYIVAADMEI